MTVYCSGFPALPECPILAEQALIYRMQNRTHYEGITDIFELAATYWVAIARGHIFNDGNKRTAFFVTMTFLYRNGIKIRDNDNTLENLTVEAATGAKTVEQLAQHLRELVDRADPSSKT
ncbi:death on curing protein [Xenorhabdus japonica]|uniref:Death on curing protein n=1 Tax=Xenorhabdus japonica TaxID=53341 RepID=A0A1I5EM49_9GAMM|nr:death on curing protein [Xenorhabdus japonica]